jgi:hypothetical protein
MWWGGLVVLLQTHRAQQRRWRWLNEGDREVELGLAMAAAVNLGAGDREEAQEGVGCMRRATAELGRAWQRGRGEERRGRDHDLVHRPAMAAAMCV